jgi:hypothetical protein
VGQQFDLDVFWRSMTSFCSLISSRYSFSARNTKSSIFSIWSASPAVQQLSQCVGVLVGVDVQGPEQALPVARLLGHALPRQQVDQAACSSRSPSRPL